MVDLALTTLQSRSRHLRLKLEGGTAADIVRAREQLRLSLVELYKLGYWRERPDLFRNYMQLFRSCRCLDTNFSERQSKSEPDKMVRYSL